MSSHRLPPLVPVLPSTTLQLCNCVVALLAAHHHHRQRAVCCFVFLVGCFRHTRSFVIICPRVCPSLSLAPQSAPLTTRHRLGVCVYVISTGKEHRNQVLGRNYDGKASPSSLVTDLDLDTRPSQLLAAIERSSNGLLRGRTALDRYRFESFSNGFCHCIPLWKPEMVLSRNSAKASSAAPGCRSPSAADRLGH